VTVTGTENKPIVKARHGKSKDELEEGPTYLNSTARSPDHPR
jgi:hypothetical protein